MRLLQWEQLLLGCSLQFINVIALSQSQRFLLRSIDNGGLEEVDGGDTSVDRPHNRKPCNLTGTQAAEGVRQYLVDNSGLKAKTKGVGFRFSKALKDVDVDTVAAWGSSVFGRELADGWLQVEDCFLPMELKGTPVLVATDGPQQHQVVTDEPNKGDTEKLVEHHLPQATDGQHQKSTLTLAETEQDEAAYLMGDARGNRRCDLNATVNNSKQPARHYFLDNSKLQARTKGVGYRLSKSITDVDVDTVAAWGANVIGYDADEDWIQVGDCYLPKTLKGWPVAILAEDTPEAKRIQELQAEVARLQADAVNASAQLKEAKKVSEASATTAAETKAALDKASKALEQAEKDAKNQNQTMIKRIEALEALRASAEENATAAWLAEGRAEEHLKAKRNLTKELRQMLENVTLEASASRAAFEKAQKDAKIQNQTFTQRIAELEALQASAEANATAARKALKVAEDASQNQTAIQRIKELEALRASAEKNATAAWKAAKKAGHHLEAKRNLTRELRAILENVTLEANASHAALEKAQKDVQLGKQALEKCTAELNALRAATANSTGAVQNQKMLDDAVKAKNDQISRLQQKLQEAMLEGNVSRTALEQAQKDVQLGKELLEQRTAELNRSLRNASHAFKKRQALKEKWKLSLEAKTNETRQLQQRLSNATLEANASREALKKAQKDLQLEEEQLEQRTAELDALRKATANATAAVEKLKELEDKLQAKKEAAKMLRQQAYNAELEANTSRAFLEQAQKDVQLVKQQLDQRTAELHALRVAATDATAAVAKQKALEDALQAKQSITRMLRRELNLTALEVTASHRALEEAHKDEKLLNQTLAQRLAELDALRKAAAANLTAVVKDKNWLGEALQAQKQRTHELWDQVAKTEKQRDAARTALVEAQKAEEVERNKSAILELEVKQLRSASMGNTSAAAAAKKALEEAQKAKQLRGESALHELEELRRAAAGNATVAAAVQQELKAAQHALEQQRKAHEAQALQVAKITAEYEHFRAMVSSGASPAAVGGALVKEAQGKRLVEAVGQALTNTSAEVEELRRAAAGNATEAAAAREALEEARKELAADAQGKRQGEAVGQAKTDTSAEVEEFRRAAAGNATEAAAAREALEEARQVAASKARQVAEQAADLSTLRDMLAKRSAEAASDREEAEEAKKEASEISKMAAKREAELEEKLASTKQAADINLAAATERVSELLEKLRGAGKARDEISTALRDCEAKTAEAKQQLAKHLAESSGMSAAAAERVRELESQLAHAKQAAQIQPGAAEDVMDAATKAAERVAVLEKELQRERSLAAENAEHLKASEGKNGALLEQLQAQEKELRKVAAAAAERVGGLQAESQAAQQAAHQALQQTTQQASRIAGLEAELVQWKQLAEQLRARGEASARAVASEQAAEARAQELKAELDRNVALLKEATISLQKEAARVTELQTSLDWLRRMLEQAQAAKAAIEAKNKELVEDLQKHVLEAAIKEEQQRRLIAQVAAERDAGAHRVQELEWFKDRAMRVMKELLARSRLSG